MSDYFSDRDLGPKPRTLEEIDIAAWAGIFTVINQRLDDGSIGYRFPDYCNFEDKTIIGCDHASLEMAILAEIPALHWPLHHGTVPSLHSVLDMLEFLYRQVAEPVRARFHERYEHWHLDYDVNKGQESFRNDINRILARNGIAFDLQPDGRIVRLAPEFLREELAGARFDTGDLELDRLLISARHHYLSSHLESRRDSLDKLWGAWERLKTMEEGPDKKGSAKRLIGMASSEPKVKEYLDQEALKLSEYGNQLMIRHKEKGQTPVNESEMVDYLFHRMFAMIQLLLKKSGRYGQDSGQSAPQGSDDYVPF